LNSEFYTGPMTQVLRRLLLVRKVWTNDSPPLQSWSVVPGAKLRRWAPLTSESRKGIKRV